MGRDTMGRTKIVKGQFRACERLVHSDKNNSLKTLRIPQQGIRDLNTITKRIWLMEQWRNNTCTLSIEF